MQIVIATVAVAGDVVHLSDRTRSSLSALMICLGAYLLVMLLQLVHGPVALRNMRPSNAIATRMIPVAAGETIAPSIARFLEESSHALAALGFNRLGVMRGSTIAGYISLSSDAAGTVATCLAMPTKDGRLNSLVGFTTQLASGAQVRTGNSALESPWPGRTGDDIARFPAERDIARLHALHRARVAKRTASGTRIAAISVGDPVGYQFNEESRSLERAVASGYYVRDGAHMRMTWKGACLNAWRRSHPFREWRDATVERAHRSLLREIGVSA